VGIDVAALHAGPVPLIIAAALGLVLGSFLNVCILAWGSEPKQSIGTRRSRCPKCDAPIAWYDNIPVLSWLILGARCRHCKAPISTMYPLVELASAAIWLFFVWRYGLSFQAVSGAVFFMLLLGIGVSDARAYIIPDEFSLGGIPLGLIAAFQLGGKEGLATALIGGAVGFAVLWLVGWLGSVLLKQEAMGGGDIKMMAMVGTFVGWTGVALTIFLGALVGTVVFLPLSLMGRKPLVPFGIFLSIGAAIAYLWGPGIVSWYTTTYLG
jgi:leader peptidase (prepilin peptidase)/N-methyltransferase